MTLTATDPTLRPGPPLAPRELVELLPKLPRTSAARAGGMPVIELERGGWRPAAARRPRHVLLVAEGLAATRSLVAGGRHVTVTGPGDLLVPYADDADPAWSVPSWRPATRLRLAVLDEHAMSAAGADLTDALLAARARGARAQASIAAAAAISRIERRVLNLLWQVGRAWGRRVDVGIELAIPLWLLAGLARADEDHVGSVVSSFVDSGRLQLLADGALRVTADEVAALERASATSVLPDAA